MLSFFGAFFCMTGKPQISPQSWERMRRHYLTGGATLKQLAQLYGVGHSTIRRHASANDWFTHKRSQRLLVQAESRNKLAQRLLIQAGELQQTARHCIPMKAEQHWDVFIRLLQLEMKLKFKKLEQTTAQEESPQPDNVVPLRRRTATRAERSHPMPQIVR